MTQEQLERANFLKKKIDGLNGILHVPQKNVIMVMESYPSNNWDKEAWIYVNRKHQQEILALLTKWRDEYQKELEEL